MTDIQTVPQKAEAIDWLYSIGFLRKLSRQGFANPFKRFFEERHKPVSVLGNGPSLKALLEKMEANINDYRDNDYCVVNNFVNYPIYRLLKPRYVTMSDPLFFMDTKQSERGHKTMRSLAENTDWDILFFIPYNHRNSSYLEPVLANPHITVVTFHDPAYWGKWLSPLALWLFKRGLGNGEFGTVVQNAMYAMMMLGYKQIDVYGIDHNFFDDLAVNDQNVLCIKDTHFYQKDTQWQPVGVSMFYYVWSKEKAFRGHVIMQQLADALGVKIYNCTPNSMVDVYERKIQQ